MVPEVSIIIPCYNSEKTIRETLNSVLWQDFKKWEALIINDGSPDNLEEIALEYVDKDPRFTYYNKENGGLGSARNYGINKSKGNIILPLDSDNMVRPGYLGNAVRIFNQNSKVGVVYGNAMYFGDKTGVWNVGRFNKYKMLMHNYIDACALIRKNVFEEVGYYDQEMPYQGHEDWEFWLRLIEAKKEFYYLEEITFDYRVMGGSMIKSFNQEMMQSNIEYVKKKHWKLYEKAMKELLVEIDQLKYASIPTLLHRIYRKLKI